MRRVIRLMVLGTGLAMGSAAEGTTFVVDSTANSGTGTLRQAILDANTNVNVVDMISFNLPGPGFTIQPTAALPTITDPVTIDGYTQLGASANTNNPPFFGQGTNAVLVVEINGALAGDCDGLLVEHVTNLGAGTTIRGLVINGFNNNLRAGIRINDDGNNTIEGNFIGTDVTGLLAKPNSDGIATEFFAAGNQIGGTVPASFNLISGNSNRGIVLDTNDNVIQGNLIGTDRSGVAALGNGAGVVLFNFAANNTLGGLGAFNPAANVISGNLTAGVIIGTGSVGHDLLGNLIGIGADGLTGLGNGTGVGVQIGGNSTTLINNHIDANAGGISISNVSNTVVQANLIGLAIGNTNNGITIFGGNNNLIGGTIPEGNLISENGGVGVQVVSLQGPANDNGILTNRILRNGGGGIDLVNGANNNQPAPLLTTASGRNGTRVQGTLTAAPSTSYRLQFFGNVGCDPLGAGDSFIGEVTAPTDGAGVLTFDVTLASTIGRPFITATATGPTQNTSEFSNCALDTDAAAAPAPTLDIVGLAAALTSLIAVAGFALTRQRMR